MAGVLRSTVEWESSNAHRRHPFSEAASMRDSNGVELGNDVFVDAFLHPVVPEGVSAVPRLVAMDPAAGVVEINAGVPLTGMISEDSSSIRLEDATGRVAGVLVAGPGFASEFRSTRRREFADAMFAASVCAPVVCAGVSSLVCEGGTTSGRHLSISGDDVFRPVLTQTGTGARLRFDAYTDYGGSLDGVRSILFVVDGNVAFDIARQDESTVLVVSPEASREDVCFNAHREDAVSTVSDTCGGDGDDEDDGCHPSDVPERHREIEAFPSESGNVSLVADDLPGFPNGVMVSTVQGGVFTRSSRIDPSGKTADELVEEYSAQLPGMLSRGAGIRIWFPGSVGGVDAGI